MPASYSYTVSSGAVITSSTPITAGVLAGATSGRDFKMSNAQGDLELLNGDLQLLTGADGIASDIASRLRTFTGDYFLDTTLGLPFDSIFGAKFNKGRIEDLYREQIRGTPGVASIESLVVTFAGRTMTVKFLVSTDFGALIEATLQDTGGN